MTTTTTSLTTFLLDRIAEDEAAAHAASRYPGGDFAVAALPTPVFEQVARHGPARVLAECAARRSMIWLEDATGEPVMYTALMHLAAVYADHPDYDPAWAVS